MNWPAAITRIVLKLALVPALLRWAVGPRIWAVAGLTWRAAIRFRLFWVMAGLLLLSVVGLPLLLKNDGTARGFIQIMLTYTLSVVTALLAFSTLWLSCGTLARDIEECQMQVVAVKPIARWQIWLGKLLGITLLNLVLLAWSGASILHAFALARRPIARGAATNSSTGNLRSPRRRS
jgi:ABC-type transport system involved in multi-copper enzyme maturation permease subunit